MTNPDYTESTSYLAWVVCFVASLFFFYEFIQMNMFNAINTQLMREFSLSAAELGKMSATYFYANVIFLFPAGMILDRVSTRKIIIVALTICVIGTFLFSLAHSLSMATLCRFMTGIGSAFCFLSCIRLASRWFPAQRLALISGLIVTMAMIGGMVAQLPLTLLVNHLGWRLAVELDALLGLVILLAVAIWVRDYPLSGKQIFHQDTQTIFEYGYWKSMKLGFLSRQNWLCGIYTSLLNLPLFLLGGLWGTLYLASVHHLDANQASYVTGMIFLGTIIGSPFMGWLSDRMGVRKLPMVIGALCSLVVAFVLIPLMNSNLYLLMMLFLLLGFVTSTQVISYPTVVESNPRALTATCVSVVSISAISGGAIFQPLFGWLLDIHWSGAMDGSIRHYSVDDFQFAMWLFPCAILVALIATAFLRETYCRKKEKLVRNYSNDASLSPNV